MLFKDVIGHVVCVYYFVILASYFIFIILWKFHKTCVLYVYITPHIAICDIS